MSYLSGRHMSRGQSTSNAFPPDVVPTRATADDYYRSANYVSDSSPRGLSGVGEDTEEDALLAGDHGGLGVGLAGGYSGSQSRPPGPTLELTGAGDDSYAGYDPGMAGCTLEPSTCHIPGISWMGSAPTEVCAQPRAHLHVRAASRGYERDEDEYAASFAPQTDATSGSTGVVAEPGPCQAPEWTAGEPHPAAEPTTAVAVPVAVAATSPTPNTADPHPPPLGTRRAGKVLRDPEIQARGK